MKPHSAASFKALGMLARNPETYSTLDDEDIGYVADRSESRSGARIHLWRTLRWNARPIAASILTALIVATGALIVMPPRYKATTLVLVDPRQPRITNTESVLSGIGADAAAVESQVELIESSALARTVIGKLNLAEDPYFTKPSLGEELMGILRPVSGAGSDAESVQLNRLIHRFQSGLSVRRRGLTYVLDISYVAPEAAKAAALSNAVAEAYLNDQRFAKLEITSQASGWLNDRIEGLREQVRIAEHAVADYRAANGIVNVTQGNKLISRQIEDLTQQLALSRTRTADAKARMERAEQVSKRTTDPAELAEALQSNVIANLRAQYAEASRLQAEYSTLYGGRHPSLIAVRSQLVNMQLQIEQELARIVAGMRNDHRAAESREKSLERELAGLVNRSGSATQADVKLHALEREAQAIRALLEQFLGRVRETKEQQSLQIPDARIISPALVPLKQTRPPVAVLLIAAAVGGGILGVGIVLVKEQMRRGMLNGDEIAQLFSIPCIASLPAEGNRALGSRQWCWWLQKSEIQDQSNCLFPSLSAYVANLHSVRPRLRRLTSARNQVLVIISALPYEGKSTFACNLAVAAACSGTSTLLIDGDVFNASASQTFRTKGPGLWEILNRRALFSSSISIHVDGKLYVLGARDVSVPLPQVQEIPERAFANLVHECRNHFDLIIVDSPAILSSVGGSVPFIESADRALMIVEWQQTERQAVREALDTLGSHATKVIGIILNKVPLHWHRLFNNGRYRDYAYSQSDRTEVQTVSPRRIGTADRTASNGMS